MEITIRSPILWVVLLLFYNSIVNNFTMYVHMTVGFLLGQILVWSLIAQWINVTFRITKDVDWLNVLKACSGELIKLFMSFSSTNTPPENRGRQENPKPDAPMESPGCQNQPRPTNVPPPPPPPPPTVPQTYRRRVSPATSDKIQKLQNIITELEAENGVPKNERRSC